MLVTLLVKFRNKDCKTTELGILLKVLPVRIVTFVETLGSHLKTVKRLRNVCCNDNQFVSRLHVFATVGTGHMYLLRVLVDLFDCLRLIRAILLNP